jgi:hypothetical protein
MFHEFLNISQTAPGRYQFITKLEREITHPLGVLTHTRKLLILKEILYICGNQLHKLGLNWKKVKKLSFSIGSSKK